MKYKYIILISALVLSGCKKSDGVSEETSLNQDIQADASDISSIDSDEMKYIKNIEIYDVNARYMDSLLDGRVPGVTFKIKNNGDRTLHTVEVRIIFKDKDGNAIDEVEYSPVLYIEDSSIALSNNKPLRPGYIWQNERGSFYSAKSVPSEWEAGSVEASVIAIEFEPEA